MAGYVIMVGREQPGKAFVGYPDNSMNSDDGKIKYVGTLKPGSEVAERVIPVGKHLIINNYRAWGRRVVDGKPVKNEAGDELHLEFNDPKYRGDIEFLKWGDSRGFGIECRFLIQSNSLDVEYQDNVQKIKIDKDKGPAQIELDAGKNEFDPRTKALFIKYLKHHPQNRESTSKNPNPEIKGHVFFEVTDDMVDKQTILNIESALEAGGIVKTMSAKPEAYRNLFEIMGRRDEFENVTTLSNDQEKYRVLLKFSQSNPTDFFALIKGFKEEVSDLFKKAESFNALDVTKNGFIAIEVEGKKEVLGSDIKGKGKEMVEWVIKNYADDDAYKVIALLKMAVSKLK